MAGLLRGRRGGLVADGHSARQSKVLWVGGQHGNWCVGRCARDKKKGRCCWGWWQGRGLEQCAAQRAGRMAGGFTVALLRSWQHGTELGGRTIEGGD